jgi:tRNA threonylcarbamoyladenosine biosynthesis protein TsaE
MMMSSLSQSPQPTQSVTIHSLDELEQWAEQWAEQLKAGDIIALNGPMGAGKTTLTQALGKALGATERINSPTFVLIHEYLTGRMPIIHTDLYRLGNTHADTLYDELHPYIEDGESIILIEWAKESDLLSSLAHWHITLTPSDNEDEPTVRHICIQKIDDTIKA